MPAENNRCFPWSFGSFFKRKHAREGFSLLSESNAEEIKNFELSDKEGSRKLHSDGSLIEKFYYTLGKLHELKLPKEYEELADDVEFKDFALSDEQIPPMNGW